MKVKEYQEVWESDFSLHNDLKDRFIRQILDCGDVQGRSTNVKATLMTQWKMQSVEFDMLDGWIQNEIMNRMGGPINAPDIIKHQLYLLDCWGVVYNKGDYTRSHIHNCAYSFVYYVRSPKGSSPLVFDTSGRKAKPDEGKIVIFPGLIKHSVPNNRCDGRVVIAGNYILGAPNQRML